MKKIIITSLFAFSVLAFGLQTSAFTYPGGAPTGGGANIAPLNVGSFAQIKQGILSAPFFGSHKIDIIPCMQSSILVSGGTSCADIGATGSHNLFKAGGIGVNPIALFVKNNGSTFAGWKTSTNFFQSTSNPIDVFRAGQVNDADALSGISVNQNGQFSVRGMTPNNPGDVLTAVDSTGLVTWAPASGGTNLPAGTFNQTLRYGVISPGVFGWTAESGLSSSGNSVKIFDAYNPANASVAAEGMGGQSPTLNLAGTFRYRGIGGVTPAAGSVLTSDAQGYATWQPVISSLPNGTIDSSTLRWNNSTSEWVENTGVLANNLGLFSLGLMASTGNTFLAIDPSADVRIGSSANALAKLHIDGDILIDDGSAQPDRILTSIDSSGLAEWRDPAFVNSLPSGLSNRTLRRASDNNPTNWIVANNLQNDGNTVSVLNEGSASNKVFQVKSNLNTTDPASTLLSLTANNRLQILPNSANYAPGKVLTATANGDADWQQVSGTLPSGTINHSTLRWNGTNWVENPKMLADQNGRVALGISPSLSGSTTFKVSGNMEVNAVSGTNALIGGQNVLMGGLRVITSSNMGNVQGKVLTASDANGLATWQDLFPSGGANGDVLTLINGSPTWSNALGGSLPAGNLNYTMRYNGTEWDQTSALQTKDEGKVGIGFNSFLGQPWTSSSASLDVNGTVRIRGGNPNGGKVLIANNSNGDAAWAPFWGSRVTDAGNQSDNGNDVITKIKVCPVNHRIVTGGVSCTSDGGGSASTPSLVSSYPIYNSSFGSENTVTSISPQTSSGITSANAWVGQCKAGGLGVDVNVQVVIVCEPGY